MIPEGESDWPSRACFSRPISRNSEKGVLSGLPRPLSLITPILDRSAYAVFS